MFIYVLQLSNTSFSLGMISFAFDIVEKRPSDKLDPNVCYEKRPRTSIYSNLHVISESMEQKMARGNSKYMNTCAFNVLPVLIISM